MTVERINPHIRYAALHLTYFDRGEESICYDARLFYLSEGEGKLTVNGTTYDIRSGSSVFLPPETKYRFEFRTEEIKLYVINFDLTEKRCDISHSIGTASVSSFDPAKVIRSEACPELSLPIILKECPENRTRLSAITDLFLKKPSMFRHYASAELKAALIAVIDKSKNGGGTSSVATAVIDFVQKNYQDPELCCSMIAREFGYHPYHISRLVKAYTSKPLHDYITDYRLTMAKSYLSASRQSVTEIAREVGFSSYTYFIKLFRERTGKTPLEYRRLARERGI